jgi:predicted Zn finger-like uncharacterized protein
MRWNCPHCQAALEVEDQQLQVGWNFSRCSSCRGHSMVRRTEVNVVRLDHAPGTGETVISSRPWIAPQERVFTTPPPPPSAAMMAASSEPLEATVIPSAPARSAKTVISAPSRVWVVAAIGICSLLGLTVYQESRSLIRSAQTALNSRSNLYSRNETPLETSPVQNGNESQASSTITAQNDTLQSSSGAPVRENLLPSVKVNVRHAILRMGPGTAHAVSGSALNGTLLNVVGSQDAWLQVNSPFTVGQTAWIRSDLVQVVKD